VKLVERMPTVCKAVIKAKGDYFEESQISYILICLTLLIGHYMSSLLFYNAEHSKNNEKPLNEEVCPNF
jgi:hypothetical protein